VKIAGKNYTIIAEITTHNQQKHLLEIQQ